MIDPIWLVIGFFFIVLLFLVAIGAFVFKMQHTLEANLTASKETQKHTQGMWYISHDQKQALEGVLYALQQQNKFIRKKEGVIISGPLPGPLPDTGPVAIAPNKSRRKKEQAVTSEASNQSIDPRYDVTATDLPAISRESIRS